MIFASGISRAHVGDDLLCWRNAPAREFGWRQHARPGVENLHRIGAGAQLLDEVARRDPNQDVDHAGEPFGFAIGHQPGRGLIRCAAPRHHVGRNGPRRAAEAEQGDIRRQLALDAADGLVDRRKHGVIGLCRKRVELRRIVQRLQSRPFTHLEGDRAAECVRHDQNVGEQDRRIEAEAPDRLERDFRRQFRREAQIEEASGTFAQRAIFRQITPGLAHEPDGWRGLRVAGEHVEDRFHDACLHGRLGSSKAGLRMRIDAIKIGDNPPEDVNVIVEVPIGGEPIKYEMDKAAGTLVVDRFLHTPMRYPGNYGFVPHTLSDDGDPIDVLIANTRPIVPGAVVNVRPIGVFKMEDQAGGDEKIIAVPVPRLTKRYAHVMEYTDMPEIAVQQIQHFFEHYKDLEPGKWVKVLGWGDAAEAKQLIAEAIERAKKGLTRKLRQRLRQEAARAQKQHQQQQQTDQEFAQRGKLFGRKPRHDADQEAGRFKEEHHDECADHGAPVVADAAGGEREENVDRQQWHVDFRHDVARIVRVERAGEARERAPDCEGFHLELEHILAGESGDLRILADRAQRAAERRSSARAPGRTARSRE